MKKISFILSFVFISNVFYGQSQSLNYDDLLGGLNTITTAVPFLQIALLSLQHKPPLSHDNPSGPLKDL